MSTLQTEGQTTFIIDAKPVTVRVDQTLVTPDRSQMFQVRAIIDGCRGGAPDQEVAGCALALLRELRFEVHDTPPLARLPGNPDEEPRVSFRVKGLLVGLLIGAPLTYGVAACSFPGCKPLFGIPLALDGLFLLVASIGGLN